MSGDTLTPVHAVDLRALIGFDAGARTFLSLYLNDADGYARLSGALSDLRIAVAEHADEADGLEQNLERVEGWLEARRDLPQGTICLFVCEALDTLEAVHVPSSLSEGAWLDASPYVRPLTEYLDESTTDVASERAEEAALWAEAQAALSRGEGAAAGAQAVFEALKQSQARVVLIARDLTVPALRCRSCGHVSLERRGRCGACGADDLFAVDLIDECVELAAWSRATLEYLDARPALSALGGVVALLR